MNFRIVKNKIKQFSQKYFILYFSEIRILILNNMNILLYISNLTSY